MSPSPPLCSEQPCHAVKAVHPSAWRHRGSTAWAKEPNTTEPKCAQSPVVLLIHQSLIFVENRRQEHALQPHFFWLLCPAGERHLHKMLPPLCHFQASRKLFFSSPLPSPFLFGGFMHWLICTPTPSPAMLHCSSAWMTPQQHTQWLRMLGLQWGTGTAAPSEQAGDRGLLSATTPLCFPLNKKGISSTYRGGVWGGALAHYRSES